jgi:hypothetical protein
MFSNPQKDNIILFSPKATRFEKRTLIQAIHYETTHFIVTIKLE